MPKGSVKAPGSKKTTATRTRARKALAASEWDMYRGAGKIHPTSGKGMSFNPKLPKGKSTKAPVGKGGR